MSIKKFRSLVRQIQKNQYFTVRFFMKGEVVELLDKKEDEGNEILSCLTRDIMFKDNKKFSWKFLLPSEKFFWEFLESLNKLEDKSAGAVHVDLLNPSGESVVTLIYYGIKMNDFEISKVSQLGDETMMVELSMEYEGKTIKA